MNSASVESLSNKMKKSLPRWWKKRFSASITESDPSCKVVYLGHVLTGWAKGKPDSIQISPPPKKKKNLFPGFCMQITHALGQPVHVGHFALKYFFFLNFKYSMFNATGLSRRKVLMEFRRTRLLFADELVTSATPFTAWQIQVERRRAFWPLCK